MHMYIAEPSPGRTGAELVILGSFGVFSGISPSIHMDLASRLLDQGQTDLGNAT